MSLQDRLEFYIELKKYIKHTDNLPDFKKELYSDIKKYCDFISGDKQYFIGQNNSSSPENNILSFNQQELIKKISTQRFSLTQLEQVSEVEYREIRGSLEEIKTKLFHLHSILLDDFRNNFKEAVKSALDIAKSNYVDIRIEELQRKINLLSNKKTNSLDFLDIVLGIIGLSVITGISKLLSGALKQFMENARTVADKGYKGTDFFRASNFVDGITGKFAELSGIQLMEPIKQAVKGQINTLQDPKTNIDKIHLILDIVLSKIGDLCKIDDLIKYPIKTTVNPYFYEDAGQQIQEDREREILILLHQIIYLKTEYYHNLILFSSEKWYSKDQIRENFDFFTFLCSFKFIDGPNELISLDFVDSLIPTIFGGVVGYLLSEAASDDLPEEIEEYLEKYKIHQDLYGIPTSEIEDPKIGREIIAEQTNYVAGIYYRSSLFSPDFTDQSIIDIANLLPIESNLLVSQHKVNCISRHKFPHEPETVLTAYFHKLDNIQGLHDEGYLLQEVEDLHTVKKEDQLTCLDVFRKKHDINPGVDLGMKLDKTSNFKDKSLSASLRVIVSSKLYESMQNSINDKMLQKKMDAKLLEIKEEAKKIKSI